MTHSKRLEETALWQIYQEKAVSDGKRCGWVKEVYEAAAEYLTDVRQTFQNYTLHDGTHILNVLEAMGGLLGDQIGQLTVGEAELMILSACMHDLGMVYTAGERRQWLEDEEACRKFLREYCPELLGRPAEEWPEDTRKWYLRTLHPFRLSEVLQNEAWKELCDRRPLQVVSKSCMIAVCQAHGENWTEIRNNWELEYLPSDDVDPLFCVLLLRLADLLDFDHTRAPKILYGYVKDNDKSRAEWDKHRASAGFRYPDSPSASDLPYKARCTNPGVEHAVRDFLDWIDEELGNCVKLQKYCEAGWRQKFPFPRAVLRNGIESDGYMSGDFCMTMDQTQILNLLTGENLYDHADVFIRELLQNAIDATLLRGEMDSDFIPEKSRIDLWEWNDKEGNIWFRIDDEGTGMTLGMLQRYFLKVGNSYYNSKELERDLRDHGRTEKYQGISRFGIGFLSCFLCGEYAEVSTLYFDSEKNRREQAVGESKRMVKYGLRLQITGLSGYYTVKNQSRHHSIEGELPAPLDGDGSTKRSLERGGYRAKPGTSIVIRLNPGKLGAMDLREAVKKYLFGARVPVYYNNQRIGQTYEEVMREAHELAGERIYELSPELKEKFDQSFPAVRGQYPKIVMSVIPLDTEEDQVLPDFSGVLVKYEVRFDKTPQWEVKGQKYEVTKQIGDAGKNIHIILRSYDVRSMRVNWDWNQLMKHFDPERVAALEEEFEKYSSCPSMQDIMDIWSPFSGKMGLYEAWIIYNDNQQRAKMDFFVAECGCPDSIFLSFCHQHEDMVIIYQGIKAGNINVGIAYDNVFKAIFLVGSMWKPRVEVSRTKVAGLPLEVSVAIQGLLDKYKMEELSFYLLGLRGWKDRLLKEWRELHTSQIDKWMWENQKDFFIEIKQNLQVAVDESTIEGFDISPNSSNAVLYKYLMAYFQDLYQMTVSYEEGQIIDFYEKKDNEMEDRYDLFPPMMFCKAVSERSRQYICSGGLWARRCITFDHPFVEWLLNNSVQLKRYFQRQFQQIVDCLCNKNADNIINQCNAIREQLISLPDHHGVDVRSIPPLSRDDFWWPEEMD